jgi:cell wall integrity and stress response component
MFLTGHTALGLLALAASAPRLVSALDPDICATFNTGNMEKFSDNLQSNGLCHDHCFGSYAFSITKGYDCWCSNYAPSEAVTVDLSDCNFPCYGYPEEPCGGDNGAYSYVRLRNVAVSGTRGSSEPSTTSTTSEPESTQADVSKIVSALSCPAMSCHVTPTPTPKPRTRHATHSQPITFHSMSQTATSVALPRRLYQRYHLSF